MRLFLSFPDFQFLTNFSFLYLVFFFCVFFVLCFEETTTYYASVITNVCSGTVLFVIINFFTDFTGEMSLGFYSFKYTLFLKFIKIFILFLTFVLIFFNLDLFFKMTYYLTNFFEYFFFTFSFILGLFFLLVGNNFLIFFLSIEIISFSLYYLIISKNSKLVIIEASLKYFIFSMLASALIMQALILFYGFFNINTFFEIFILSSFFEGNFLFVYYFCVSVLFLIFGFFFKLSLAPFHFWSPDILEVVNYSVFLFFVLFTKLTYFVVLLKILTSFNLIYTIFYFVFLIISIYSMSIGILGSIYQTKLKRFLAYSSIFHGGFFLISIISNFFLSIIGFFFYYIYYVFFYFNFVIFLNILSFYNNKYFISNIYEIQIFKQNNYIAVCILVLIFFLMGIPPLVSFLTKYVFIFTLIYSNIILISFFFFFFSIISVFYYLKICRVFFFDKIYEYSFYIVCYKKLIINVFILFLLFIIFFDYSEIFNFIYLFTKLNKC